MARRYAIWLLSVKAAGAERMQSSTWACQRGKVAAMINGNAQDEVISFMQSGGAFSVAGSVDHAQTHCAHVFLWGDVAMKIKRAIRFDYLDQSTLELRHDLLCRELSLNKPRAPMI